MDIRAIIQEEVTNWLYRLRDDSSDNEFCRGLDAVGTAEDDLIEWITARLSTLEGVGEKSAASVIARIQAQFGDDLVDCRGDLYEQIKEFVAQFYIERQQHSTLATRVRRLEEAVRFYADPQNHVQTDHYSSSYADFPAWHNPSAVMTDGGEVARAALTPETGGEENHDDTV